jgi:hypothetical protein
MYLLLSTKTHKYANHSTQILIFQDYPDFTFCLSVAALVVDDKKITLADRFSENFSWWKYFYPPASWLLHSGREKSQFSYLAKI